MKGSFTATMSTSLCSTLRARLALVQVQWGTGEDVRIAEDDTANATEAVDTNLREGQLVPQGAAG